MKYMGSKRIIGDKLLPFILAYRKPQQYYVEPFVGGCNMIEKVRGLRIGSDNNEYLIEMWKHLQLYPNDFPKKITRQLYEAARRQYNQERGGQPNTLAYPLTKAEIGWIGFMGSFNGRFFDGGYAAVKNVDEVRNLRNYIGENIKNILIQIKLLKGVEFYYSDYKTLSDLLPPKSIIYCDPPYQNTKKYSTSNGFNKNEFAEWTIKMVEKGHSVFISEYNMPSDFKQIAAFAVNNSMNLKKTINAVERLFVPPNMNYQTPFPTLF